jgi:hypothetical protein
MIGSGFQKPSLDYRHLQLTGKEVSHRPEPNDALPELVQQRYS